MRKVLIRLFNFMYFHHYCFFFSRSNPRRSASRNRLNNTTPARLEGKAQVPQGQGQGRAGSVPRGGRSNTTSAAASKDSSNHKKESTAGNVRNKGATSASPPKRPVSAAGECTFFDLHLHLLSFAHCVYLCYTSFEFTQKRFKKKFFLD